MNVGRIIRALAGIALIIFGFNKFFHWMPSPYHGEALTFFNQLETVGGGYILVIAGVIEIAAGLSFVTNRFVPLMAVMLFPIMLNAFLFNLFLDDTGGAILGSRIFLTINVVVLITFRKSYIPLLKPQQS